MIAKLKGGPYDGVELDHNDINLYTKFWPIGLRQFIFLPPFDQWDAVRRGDVDKDADLGMRVCYELIRRPNGSEGIHDPTGEVFATAARDQQEGRGPKPVQRPFTGAYYECVRGDWALTQSERFLVTDEKGRKWACRKITNEEGERSDIFAGAGELSRAHDASGSTERLSVSTLHCESVEELPAKLADVID